MKKIALILVITIMLITLCSCGNMAVIDPGNFTYKHVHVSDAIEGHCFAIDKWWDSGNGIEVRRADSGDGVFLSEGSYQLFESASTCPYCK